MDDSLQSPEKDTISSQLASSPEQQMRDDRQVPPLKEDGYEPSEEETAVYIHMPDGWRAMGLSIRGLQHCEEGRYRDDACVISACESWFLASVADGAGSAKQSRLGAREACLGAVRYIEENIRALQDVPVEQQLRELLFNGMAAAIDQVQHYADSTGLTMHDLATTLLLIAHHHQPDGNQILATAQIGDGSIAAFTANVDGTLLYHELARPDEGDFGGGTIFLSQVPPQEWHERIQVFSLPKSTAGIMLLTDGISDAFKPQAKHLWQFMQFMQRHVITQVDESSTIERLRQAINFSFPALRDDRTIVLIHPPQEEASQHD